MKSENKPRTASVSRPASREKARFRLSSIPRSYANSVRRLIFEPIIFVWRSFPKILAAAAAILVPLILTGLALLLSPARPLFLSGWLGPIRIFLLWVAFLFVWSLAVIFFRALLSWLSISLEHFEEALPEEEEEDEYANEDPENLSLDLADDRRQNP